MKGEYYFRVADFLLKVSAPEGLDMLPLLPAFVPFLAEKAEEEVLVDCCICKADGHGPEANMELLDDSLNDMGRVCLYASPDEYGLKISSRNDEHWHYAVVDKHFRRMEAFIDFSDRYAGEVISSLLRIAFSQAIIPYRGISIHASAVCLDGMAYLFLGRSGTGKSTHACLWMDKFKGGELLNDDNPVLRLRADGVWAYGTPWSGKTPCYKNRSLPVGGMVRLRQAIANQFFDCTEMEAFIALLPGCSVLRRDKLLYNVLCDTLVELVEQVAVGWLDCLPDGDAAILCRNKLRETKHIKNHNE